MGAGGGSVVIMGVHRLGFIHRPSGGGGGGGGLPVTNGLVLHLDAESISANDGDLVSTWPADTGVDASTKSGADSPTYRANWTNSLPGVDFTNSTNRILLASGVFGGIDLENQDITVFVVGELFGSSARGDRPFGWDDRDTTPIWYFAMDGSYRFNNGSLGFSGPPTTPTVYSFMKNGNLYSVWYNSTNQLNEGSHSTGSNLNDDLHFGDTQSGSNDALFGEIVVYDRVLTSTERQDVENHLTTKWGL